MKYEFIKVDLDTYKLVYTSKDKKEVSIEFKRTIEMAEKLQGIVATARLNMYKELSKQYFGAYELQKGSYRLQGYQFDFTPFLKRFLIRYNGENSYSVVFALNKTNIFDNMYISRSQINDIIEDVRHNVIGM